MNASTILNAADAEIAKQDAAAESPDVPTSAPGATAGAGQKRTRKPSASAKGNKATPRKPVPTRKFVFKGETFDVPKTLSDALAEKFASKLLAAKAGRENGTPDAAATPDVDRKPAAKPKATRAAAPKVEDGMVAIRLSKTAWEQAFAGSDGAEWRKQNAGAWKTLKGAKARSVGSSIAYFATVKVEEADEVVAHLKATAKAWEKRGTKTRDANPAPLARNAAVIAAQVKTAK